MRFLMGSLVGLLIAVGVVLVPDTRSWVLELVSLVNNRIDEVQQSASHHSEGKPKASLVKKKAELHNDPLEPIWAEDIQEVDQEEYVQQVPDQQSLLEQVPATPVDVLTSTAEFSDILPSLLPDALFHAVWSPFRSELSAHGFADSLTTKTGREFKVVQVGRRYQVGFNYHSEAERASIVDAVASATGERAGG